MNACIFCGAQAPVNYKNLQHSFVASILQGQHAAGIDEPVVHLMRNILAAEMHKAELSGREDDNTEDVGSTLHSCMCCYYWVARRMKQKIVPLPMQNLLWFVRTLEGCESLKAARASDATAGFCCGW